jgi:epoxyqueuosine reductase
MKSTLSNYYELANKIKLWGKELGFQKVGIADIDLSKHEDKLQEWLDNGFHGDMEFMARHGMKRCRPAELLPGTVSVVSVRLDYLPPEANFATSLSIPQDAYISRYALGRDYHKVIRNRLKKLGNLVAQEIDQEDLLFRPFVDSAPVLERPLAEKAGLGWVGKHSLLLDEEAGSWFFIGELFLPIQLPLDEPKEEQCGSCVACLTICPTQAIVAPYVVDSRKCISYLTIELKDDIPVKFRRAMGNRIYGCDDCQLICPWNRAAQISQEPDFLPRNELNQPDLLNLWEWTEAEFLKITEGSPIRRIGYASWMRNIAIGLGNAPFSMTVLQALKNKLNKIDEMVDRHIHWAIEEQESKAEKNGVDNRKLKRLIKAVRVGLPRDA